MIFLTPLVSLLAVSGASAAPARKGVQRRDSTNLLTDINAIQTHWGQIRPYNNSPASYFGVKNTGLPDGCGYEQVHILHRHGSRYPTSGLEDGTNNERFAQMIANITAAKGPSVFSGPLSFLNTYSYQLGRSLLVPTGAAQEFKSGSDFWNTRGRLLYNAPPGETYYNATFTNGTTRPKPTLRTTSQARIYNSAVAWASGFFGTALQGIPSAADEYNLLVIPEGGTENNTLASYDSCPNINIPAIGYLGDSYVFKYIPLYLGAATNRLNAYTGGNKFTANDTYAMQSICAYEYNALGSSKFCGLFTEAEWEGFEYTLDLEYYYDNSFGNPTGRAQGIGYVQELLARLDNQYITVGDSSVNATLDNNASTFPLGQSFYLDMTHDDILVAVIAALSIAYFKSDLPPTAVPPPSDRAFRLSYLTPFGTRLFTEVIGCNSPNPTEKQTATTLYTPTSNGYNPATATNKFVRMVWNDAVVPLSSIQGGACNNGRSDGLCGLDNFKANMVAATAKANYQYSCSGNYTLPANFNGDGSIFAP
ncbi:hypothetical protein FRB94_007850 [Tulasnella sp. JGI-2019a]|nr:hypothetical protein FRB93_007790 [Tulasnella sp. JGI-2019a]KAG8997117.1 hypothetical protein FRB94_007850 [Tulasnella sp. JGI-2019a]